MRVRVRVRVGEDEEELAGEDEEGEREGGGEAEEEKAEAQWKAKRLLLEVLPLEAAPDRLAAARPTAPSNAQRKRCGFSSENTLFFRQRARATRARARAARARGDYFLLKLIRGELNKLCRRDLFKGVTVFAKYPLPYLEGEKQKIRILKIIGARYTTTMRPPPPAHQKPPGCSTKLCF